MLSAFFIFLPDDLHKGIYILIPFVLDFVALLVMILLRSKINNAACLRKYFDSYVLNIGYGNLKKSEKRKLKEIAKKEYNKNPKKAKIQMSNTGKDLPPGVRDWYVFSESFNGKFARFECQCQNIWWNSKMLQKRLIITICIAILVGCAFCILAINKGLLISAICSSGLVVKIIEQLIENVRYIIISIKIDGAKFVIESDPIASDCVALQELIDKRRSINILKLNFLHKKNDSRLSKLYEDITT